MKLFNWLKNDRQGVAPLENDYLGESLRMTAPPRWGVFTGPTVYIEGMEGTFGARLDRNLD